MKPIVKFIINLQFIFRPRYWLFNNSYSKEWDQILNQLLDEHKFTNIQKHHAELGPTVLWIENIPYACMHTDRLFLGPMPDPRFYPKYCNVRPSRLTIIRCLKRLKLDARSPDEIRDDTLKKLLKC